MLYHLYLGRFEGLDGAVCSCWSIVVSALFGLIFLSLI
jgi:hypothetical protein